MGRLKLIPNILSPELLYTLAAMGHGDNIGGITREQCQQMEKTLEVSLRAASTNQVNRHAVFGDANFPSSSVCRRNGPKEIRADGHSIPELLEAVLKLLPLDAYVDAPVALMKLEQRDELLGMEQPSIWATYKRIINDAEGRQVQVEQIPRFAFYERAKQAFAVVHTGETALYGNIILTKGVIAN